MRARGGRTGQGPLDLGKEGAHRHHPCSAPRAEGVLRGVLLQAQGRLQIALEEGFPSHFPVEPSPGLVSNTNLHSPIPVAALSPHFSPQHPELRHLLTHRADCRSSSHGFHSAPVKTGLSQLPAQVPNWPPKGDTCSQLCHSSHERQLPPGSGWDRTQDSHLLCSTATPDPAKLLRAPGGRRAATQPPAAPLPESRAWPPHGNTPA